MQVCLAELEMCLPSGETPERNLESHIIGEVINRYLAMLTKQNRLIFVRRYFSFDSCTDIAKSAGLTEQAVRLRLLRMRQGLRE